MPLASAWRSRLPAARFTAPDAPMHHRYGHQWFSTEGNVLDPARIVAARDGFDAVIGDLVWREGFDHAYERVAFVGVSHGAIVALDAVASGRWPVGALVSFAGLLPPQTVSPAGKDTPILLVHGQSDTTIPPMASNLAAAQLGAAGFKIQHEVEAGIGHTISSSGADKALKFLMEALA
ncbi:dienelactone hydrolase family protein [Agrobacterium sp. CR_3]|uniref:alpha/beta hydrolase n=1 Tax=Agrobacterium sp. CR_3 TaxID=3055791 RepID=UPI0035BEBF15